MLLGCLMCANRDGRSAFRAEDSEQTQSPDASLSGANGTLRFRCAIYVYGMVRCSTIDHIGTTFNLCISYDTLSMRLTSLSSSLIWILEVLLLFLNSWGSMLLINRQVLSVRWNGTVIIQLRKNETWHSFYKLQHTIYSEGLGGNFDPWPSQCNLGCFKCASGASDSEFP